MMENTKAICDLCRQISKSTEQIGDLTLSMEEEGCAGISGLRDLYDDARLSELETAQQMILLLTSLLTAENGQGENVDESEGVFAEGELNDVKGGADESTDSPTGAGGDRSEDGEDGDEK